MVLLLLAQGAGTAQANPTLGPTAPSLAGPVPPGAPAAPAGAASTPAPRRPSCGFRRVLAVLGAVAAYCSSALAGATALPAAPDLPAPGPLDELCPNPDPAPAWAALVPPAACPAVLEEAIVLALYHPVAGDRWRHFNYEVARTGAERIEILGERPDLSTIAPDGELLVGAHGHAGHFSDRQAIIPIGSVLEALTDPRWGLPLGFHGRIRLMACQAGRTPFAPVPRSLLEDLRTGLVRSGASEACAREVADAVAAQRRMSRSLESDIEARLARDAGSHPSPGRQPVDRVMGLFRATIGQILRHRNPDALVDQVAAGLAAAGYTGIEVSAPTGDMISFAHKGAFILEVTLPGIEHDRLRNVIRDLTRFYYGSIDGSARDRLAAMGVDPAFEGVGIPPDPEPCRPSAQPEPHGADLIAYVPRWLDCYGAYSEFVHASLLAMNLTEAIGQAKAFHAQAEGYARVLVGGPGHPIDDFRTP
jgi:hypothetical protein